MIKQIGTVAVYVEDQQKAKQFWAEKVGFDIAADHPMGPDASCWRLRQKEPRPV